MSFKEKIIEVIKTEKTVKFLLYIALIGIILDATTTLYALKKGLNEGNIFVYFFIQKYGADLGLIILSGLNFGTLLFAYILFKRIFPIFLAKSNRNRVLLLNGILIFLLLYAIERSLSAIVNNLSILSDLV